MTLLFFPHFADARPFLASTASSLKFADGTQFSATAPQATPLLTIGVPIGLQFGSTPGEIRVQGPGAVRNPDPDNTMLLNREAGLHVQPNQTLALIGGSLSLQGSILTTDGGRIELGSVAGPNLVLLTPISKGWSLSYEGIQNFQDIKLSQQAAVDTSGNGGGDIQVQGNRVILTDGSQMEASTLGAGNGGNLSVNASDLVQVIGTSADGNFPSGLQANAKAGATGEPGNLSITTEKLIASDGGQVITSTSGPENGGNLSVNASDLVQVMGASADGYSPSGLPSGLATIVQGGATGSGGNLRIVTRNLIVSDGAQLSTSTYGQKPGRGGNFSVYASNSVQLSGALLDPQSSYSGLYSQAFKESTADAGDLTIVTGRLILRDGSAVAGGNYGQGHGGNLSVSASSVSLSGINFNGGSSGLFTGNYGVGDGGSIAINSSTLLLSNGAVVSAITRGSGNSGNITVNANRFQADNGSQILTTTFSEGKAGNITLNISKSIAFSNSDPTFTAQLAQYPDRTPTQFGKNVFSNEGSVVSGLFANTAPGSIGEGGSISVTYPTKLTLTDGSTIAVNSLGAGKAGSLNIQAGTIMLDGRSSLLATTAITDGGNVNLQAQDLLLMRHGSQISATAGTAQAGGNGGNVNINTGALTALENSNITANAFQGRGGNVQITAQGIFRSPDSTFSASSRFGINGTVRINTLDVSRNLEVAVLPVRPVDYTKLIAPGCPANARGSKFVVTGSGGLPPSPSDTVSSDNSTIEDWGTVQGKDSRASTVVSSNLNDSDSDGIVKATGWVTDSKGHVVALVAQAPTLTPDIPWLKSPSCHAQ